MALVGVRDMSVIETPPEDRLPIQTRVAEASAGLVRDAILRELDRGGQVFFVHNRVETIEAQAEQLRRLLPDARIVVGHGQMAEGALERVMLAFAAGEHDVLVCTTIIESGLDIPNANTIVIDRADTFGLAQLYQLRGRVGRSARRAYAYLLYRRRAQLSDIARKRLQAIFNASELGAGFQIALADLEIRGAGNLLGAEQHGHIAAVGFDLYTRLLAEAVEERRRSWSGARRPARPARSPRSTCPWTPTCPTTTWPRSPRSWSSTDASAGWRRTPGWTRCAAELLDRYGPPPAPVERLLEVSQLRSGRGGRPGLGRPRGRAARAALRVRLVARGDHASPGAARRRRPAARPGRAPPLRLQPPARAAAPRRCRGVAADSPARGAAGSGGRARGSGAGSLRRRRLRSVLRIVMWRGR